MLTDGRTTDDRRRTTDARVTGILIAHLGAFGSGELKKVHLNALGSIFDLGIKKVKVNLEPSFEQIW